MDWRENDDSLETEGSETSSDNWQVLVYLQVPYNNACLSRWEIQNSEKPIQRVNFSFVITFFNLENKGFVQTDT